LKLINIGSFFPLCALSFLFGTYGMKAYFWQKQKRMLLPSGLGSVSKLVCPNNKTK